MKATMTRLGSSLRAGALGTGEWFVERGRAILVVMLLLVGGYVLVDSTLDTEREARRDAAEAARNECVKEALGTPLTALKLQGELTNETAEALRDFATSTDQSATALRDVAAGILAPDGSVEAEEARKLFQALFDGTESLHVASNDYVGLSERQQARREANPVPTEEEVLGC